MRERLKKYLREVSPDFAGRDRADRIFWLLFCMAQAVSYLFFYKTVAVEVY